MTPSLSVVVPTHLPPDETRALIDKCCGQLGSDDELIVVVDQPLFAEQYQSLDQSHTGVQVLVNDRNRGASHSRNRGVVAAKGDIVLLIDADSHIPDNLVDSHRQAHASGGDVPRVIAGKTFLRDTGAWYAPYAIASIFFRTGYELQMQDPASGDLYFAPTANLSAPRQVFADFPFDEGLAKAGGSEDNYFCLQVRQHCVIRDEAAAIEQDVWPGLWRGIIRRVFRWGFSWSQVMAQLADTDLSYCLVDRRVALPEHAKEGAAGNPVPAASGVQAAFDLSLRVVHRLGFLFGCLRQGRWNLRYYRADYAAIRKVI